MTFADFDRLVRADMDACDITDANERALLRAMCRLESKSIYGDYPTRLAQHYHNLFGVRWYDRDKGRYEFVVMPSNQFDLREKGNAGTVKYRRYRDRKQCLTIQQINLFLRPQVYLDAKRKAYAAGGGDKPDWETWINEIAPIYCPTNPAHGALLIRLYREYLTGARG
jgi:hypothetical protein